jgi:Flp pilus assembly protein TadG
MHFMAPLKTSRYGEQGQAIVEMALTLPLLLLVVLGMFDFGLLFQRFEVVTNAAREGARLAVLTSQYSTANAQQRAFDYLASGGITGGSVGCNAGAAGSLCVTVTPGTTTIAGTTPPITVNEMVVTVEYDHQHIFVGPIMQLFGGNLGVTPLKAVSRMRVE